MLFLFRVELLAFESLFHRSLSMRTPSYLVDAMANRQLWKSVDLICLPRHGYETACKRYSRNMAIDLDRPWIHAFKTAGKEVGRVWRWIDHKSTRPLHLA